MTESGPVSLRGDPVGYLALLRENRDFRRLWFGELVSFAGDWFNAIALYAAVEELSGSTEAIAAVFVAKLLPVFLMTPIAGPLCDRFDRRKIMLITDFARAACAVGLVFAYRARSLPLIFGLLVVMVAFAGVFIPAKSAVVPQITTERQLNAANALSAGTWSVMLAAGAAGGGLVTEYAGIEVALLCDALTFLVSAAFLYGLPALLPTADEPHRDGPPSSGAATDSRSFVDGLRYLKRRPYLAVIICLKPGMALAGGTLAMLPVFATQVFTSIRAPLAMAVLYTARGLGAMIGSLAVRKIFGDRRRTMNMLIPVGYVLLAVGYLGLAVSANLWQAGLGYFTAAFGGGAIWVFSGTLGQLESDNAYRGRVFAIEWGVLTLTLSATAWLSGALIERFGWTVRDVALASSCVVFLPLVAWLAVLASRREKHAS
ncbi:MAG: MFS transporter [Polyangiaceae bacterium]